MKNLTFVALISVASLCGAWSQDGAPGPDTTSSTPTGVVEFSGRTQLYIDWARPLTATERAFLATVPEGTDGDGQSFRELIEICFRSGIAHAESAPRYGWTDRNGVVYNYAYYCRLLQPADAAHIWHLRLATWRLPELESPAPAVPVEAILLQPATLATVCLDLLPVESKDVEVTTAVTPTAPCRPAGGVLEHGGPAREVREPIGAISLVSEARDEEPYPPPSDGTCGPGTPPTPPPPNDPGVVAPPGDPSGPVPCPPDSDPYAPPAQPDHGTVGQPWEPMPDSPTVADPVVPEGAPGDSTAH